VLAPAELKQREAVIARALRGGGHDVALLLAGQFPAVANLSFRTGNAILDFLRREPAPELAAVAQRCLADASPDVRGAGYELMGLANDPAFPATLTAPPGAMEVNPAARRRYLALAVALRGSDDLVAEGRRRVQEWNRIEKDLKAKWTGGGDFSLAAPEHPLLDAEALFERIAWLAYLSRHDAPAFATQFAREWLMTAQYEDYCDRSIGNLWGDNMSAGDRRRAEVKTEDWNFLRAAFARLREVTQGDVARLMKSQADVVAAGFAQAHFTAEARTCMDLLAGYPVADSRPMLQALTSAKSGMLADFARARLAAAAP
jgi:hypothetical protein